MSEYNPLSKINVPEKLFVGLRPNSIKESIVPYGVVVEMGETKAAQKNIERVKRYTQSGKLEPAVVDNIPLMGFKLGSETIKSRNWEGDGEMVRVTDPRGFETDITVSNLMMCMASTIIEGGEILNECVWGRIGQRTLLLPTNSEPYLHMLDSQKRLSEAISLRDVKIGEKIRLVTGEVGYYFGKMHAVMVFSRYSDAHDVSITPNTTKRYVLKRVDGDNIVYQGYSEIKVAEVLESLDKPRDKKDIEAETLQAYRDQSGTFYLNTNMYYKNIIGWVYDNKGFAVTYGSEQVDEESIVQIAERFDNRSHRYPRIYAVSNRNDYLYVGGHYKENFVTPRNAPNRSYTSRGSFYYRSTPIFTTGFIGLMAKCSGGVFRTSASGDTAHMEESELKEFVILNATIRTKAGVEETLLI